MNKNQMNLLILCIMGVLIAQNLELSLALPICLGYAAFVAVTFLIPRKAWDKVQAENDGDLAPARGPIWKRGSFWIKGFAITCIAYTLGTSSIFAMTFMK